MRFISIMTLNSTNRLPTEAEMASMHKLIVEGMKAGWLIECEGVPLAPQASACTKLPAARSRSPTALSPRLKRSSAATPSSTPRARKKQLNTRGVSSTTSAREPAREPGREPGRPTSFSRCRREKDSSFSELDFQRMFRHKCRIQVDWLFSSCRHRHDPQPRTPATKSSIAVLSPRLKNEVCYFLADFLGTIEFKSGRIPSKETSRKSVNRL